MRWWAAIVGAGLAVFIWNTEAFQRSLFPMRYWRAQAMITHGAVALDRAMLRQAEHELGTLRPISVDVADGLAFVIERDLLRKEIDMWKGALAYDQAVLEDMRIRSLEEM